MSDAQGELKDFGMSPERGFLPDRDPLERLPEPFGPWEAVAAQLPRLLPARALRPSVAALAPFETARLGPEPEWRRAMVLLSFLGHAYVWSEESPARALPAVLARPWCAVAERLGRPPVLSYASYALDNWRRLDPRGPLELGNLALIQNFLGGADEDWFILVHVEIEARAASVLRELLPAARASQEGRQESLEAALGRMGEGLQAMVATLLRMPEWCDPAIYFRRVRPYIHGWKDHPALAEGLLYEGVDGFAGRPKRLRGETGAQSSIVPALDAVLGVEHADDPLRTYLAEMRDYMPPGHRAFLTRLESGGSVRAQALAGATALREAYDTCLQWLERFRSIHLEYADRYIARQGQPSGSNPADVGTGGTPFLRYLRKHRDETARSRD